MWNGDGKYMVGGIGMGNGDGGMENGNEDGGMSLGEWGWGNGDERIGMGEYG